MNKFLSLIFNSDSGKTNDVMGEYPVKLHVPAMPERRYLNTTRIMTLLSIFSICVMMVLAIFLYLLPPQIRSVPRFAAVNSLDNDIQWIGSFSSRAHASYFIVEKLVSDYVVMRRQVVPNVEAMKDHYKEGQDLGIFSSGSTFTAIRNDSSRILRDIERHGLKRDVKILWAKPLTNGVWRVRYEITDTYRDTVEPEVSSWYAIVTFAFRPGALSRSNLMKNPFGFIVTDYKDVKTANNPDDVKRFIFEE